jgi:hypothetical protein
MHLHTLASTLVLALGFTGFVVSAASASVLPGASGASLTGASGKVTLQIKGGAAVTCQSSASTGEVISIGESLAVTNFGTKCTVGGLAVNSLGDPIGIILAHAEIDNDCSLPLYALKYLPLHLEVPSTKLLLLFGGSLVGEVAPSRKKSKSFTLTIAQKEGKQAIEKCEGGSVLTLTASTDAGEAVQSAQESAEGTLAFSAEEEFMA